MTRYSIYLFPVLLCGVPLVITAWWSYLFAGNKLGWSKNKRALVNFGATTLWVITFSTSCCALPMMLGNLLIYQRETSLYNYPLPPSTRVIGQDTFISRNEGSGNYCIFIIRRELSTSLSRQNIQAYYEEAHVPIGRVSTPIWLEFNDEASASGEIRYTIEIEDMISRFFDMRC